MLLSPGGVLEALPAYSKAWLFQLFLAFDVAGPAAAVLESLGRPAEARQAAETALRFSRKSTSHWEAHLVLGRLAAARGEVEAAEASLEQAARDAREGGGGAWSSGRSACSRPWCSCLPVGVRKPPPGWRRWRGSASGSPWRSSRSSCQPCGGRRPAACERAWKRS